MSPAPLARGSGEEPGGAEGQTIWSPDGRRRPWPAAAGGGIRCGHGSEREGEGKGDRELRLLTRSAMAWTARPEEVGRRRGGARRRRHEAEKKRTIPANHSVLASASRRGCWEYALEAIIKWFISIFIFMIIVYSPCYNCINRKHNTCVEYKQPVVPSKPLPDWFVSQDMVRVS